MKHAWKIRTGMAMAAMILAITADPPHGEAQSVCDANGDGAVTLTDGVQTLRAAAELSSSCTTATCDVNGDGTVTVADGVNVLRAAASLTSLCEGGGVTPTPAPTPRPAAAAVEACDDDCRAALQVCGGDVFFDEHDSIEACTEDCVEVVEDYASDVGDFDGCVDAHVQFIQCCTNARQCGEIPEGCNSEFSGAVNACGGSFGGCPMIFFDPDGEEEE